MKRTITDKLISSFNSLRFFMTEPILLRIMRWKHEKSYRNDPNPFITVYIPTYNRAKLLMERAVPSVLSQTYKNFELVIVGDHCTDETEELVLKIKDPRVRFYNIPTRGYRYPPTAENHWFAGPVVASNKALELARGRWICLISDDDIWTKDHLESLLNFAQKNNFEFVSGLVEEERFGKKIVAPGVHAVGPYFNPTIKVEDKNSPQFGSIITWLYRSYLSFMKYNSNCWRKSWNRPLDSDMIDRMYKAGVRIGFLNKVVGYVMPRPGEQTIGLEAYKAAEKEKIEHFKFNKH
ncbi:MAG: glycosyltransferase family 2 protein [bacterium]|nr:glycosyltransferase family 2 protein [bacterium]